ncbi:Uncharacterized protein TCAP_02107 [Tolypocladium capitatum]|uniref:Uncharacterized protein n=1 Tax=Tolypocladium capitatum TaxID=45235 RepID=A0A2K3QK94_9HYPO|nr:Uncharacterized protein TCAP_02107 [Tolypocladium capitatum]
MAKTAGWAVDKKCTRRGLLLWMGCVLFVGGGCATNKMVGFCTARRSGSARVSLYHTSPLLKTAHTSLPAGCYKSAARDCRCSFIARCRSRAACNCSSAFGCLFISSPSAFCLYGSAGALRFFESCSFTVRPLGPGTAPPTSTTPSSLSTLSTLRFCTVTHSLPMRPGIFLPGMTRLPLPCEGPVVPIVRWFLEFPCEAPWPLKPWRFMPPAKPMPRDLARTSTYWPSWNQSGSSCTPTGSRPCSSRTMNSASSLLGAMPLAS